MTGKLAEHSDGSSTLNNIEHMGIAFLQDTLAPIVATIENEFNNKLFRPKEIEEGYYIEFPSHDRGRGLSLFIARISFGVFSAFCT